jgi:hypothetical protein
MTRVRWALVDRPALLVAVKFSVYEPGTVLVMLQASRMGTARLPAAGVNLRTGQGSRCQCEAAGILQDVHGTCTTPA